MPHLAARAWRLAVVVEVHPGMRQQGLTRRQPADEVDHGAVAAGARLPERQGEDGAPMVLELTGDGPLDGPVPRIMYARGHLVGDQLAAAHKELDRQDAGIAEVLQHAR